MPDHIQTDHFTAALFAMLDETFDNVQGFFLDKGTSMFETLATISAEEASMPVGGQCLSRRYAPTSSSGRIGTKSGGRPTP